MPRKTNYRCAVVGYGGAFNQGKSHANEITRVPGLELVAVCDVNPERAQAAKADFPQVTPFTDVGQMLDAMDLDLVAIVTPHNLHAPIALQCLNKGVGVVLEKPMCITVDEANAMIAAAKAHDVVLSVFHNRRFDGDYLALKELVAKGTLGRIFKVEMFHGGYGRPGDWWRSKKEVSGGIAYDWGAHYLDWLLDLLPGHIAEIAGFIQPDLIWHDVSNEDHWESFIRFDDGCIAELEFTSSAAIGKPRWRVLGTKGAAVSRDGHFEVRTQLDGYWATLQVPYHKGAHHKVYDSISAHLLHGEPLAITPEAARRIIAVLDWTERAANAGKPLVPDVR